MWDKVLVALLTDTVKGPPVADRVSVEATVGVNHLWIDLAQSWGLIFFKTDNKAYI